METRPSVRPLSTILSPPSQFVLLLPSLFFIEGGSDGPPTPPEQQSPVREGVLLHRMDTPPSPAAAGTTSSPPPLESSRRVCRRCSRVLASFLHDPHSVCVSCRGLCYPGKRCAECSNWCRDDVLAAYDYQCTLRHGQGAQSGQSKFVSRPTSDSRARPLTYSGGDPLPSVASPPPGEAG